MKCLHGYKIINIVFKVRKVTYCEKYFPDDFSDTFVYEESSDLKECSIYSCKDDTLFLGQNSKGYDIKGHWLMW